MVFSEGPHVLMQFAGTSWAQQLPPQRCHSGRDRGRPKAEKCIVVYVAAYFVNCHRVVRSHRVLLYKTVQENVNI